MSPKRKTKKAVKKARPIAKKLAIKKKITKKKKIVEKKGSTQPAVPSGLQVVGEVTHFFPHVSAGVIKLAYDLKVGDMVQMKGHTTNFKQTAESMQIDHVPVNEAKKGQEIGLKVKDRVRIGDMVYKL